MRSDASQKSGGKLRFRIVGGSRTIRTLGFAGHGHTAHIFDDFAPLLTNRFQILALTRDRASARPSNLGNSPISRLNAGIGGS